MTSGKPPSKLSPPGPALTVNHPQATVLRTFRLRKEVAAYVCNILESQEGITTFSTIPPQAGDPHRDLKLLIPIGFVAEVEALMNQLKSELNLETGDAIYELENES